MNERLWKIHLNDKTVSKRMALKDRKFFHEHYIDTRFDLPDHADIIFDFIDEHQKCLILLPRDHLKSTIGPFSYMVQEICKNPEIKVLIAQETQRAGMKTLKQIREALGSEKIRKDFPMTFKKDTDSLFYLDRKGADKDPTAEAVGCNGSILGNHPDIIAFDDIISLKNSLTEGMRFKIDEWFKTTLLGLAEPHTKVIGFGTRKNFADLYNLLIKDPSWAILKLEAIQKYPDDYKYIFHNINGKQVVKDIVEIKGTYKVLWPDKWGIKNLLKKKYEIGTVYFNREYQNNPQSEETAPLKQQWLRYYHFAGEEPIPNGEPFPILVKRRFSAVDPARSRSEKADYFVLISIVIDNKNRIFVEPYIRDKLSFPDQVNCIVKHLDTKKPQKMAIENNFYQDSLVQAVRHHTLRGVVGVTERQNKEERIIDTLSHIFEQNVHQPRIFIHQSMKALIDEYVTFPRGEHDDVLDALEKAVRLGLDSKSVGNFGFI